MKVQAILCAALAGTFGFSSLAVAQDGGRRSDRQDRVEQRQNRVEQRQERREMRQERRQDRREVRQDRRQDRRELRAERRDDRRDRQVQRVDRAWNRGYNAAVQQPRHVYQQPRYNYSQPSYVYSQPSYPRYYRGGYLPQTYRNSGYYVNNWNAYPQLYAPPYGHQWVQVGSDFLLVALATGLIANLLTH